jgi:hypothetical protein
MIPELRSWVQFLSVTQFSAVRISPSLASVGSVGTTTPEQEQTMPTTHTQEGEY